MDRVELITTRRVLSAFIGADEVEISLQRSTKTNSGNGSWTETTVALPPQKFRMIPFKRRLTHQESNTQDGDIPITPYVLVGRHGCDVQRDDEFTFAARWCKVIGVEPTTADPQTTDRVVVEFEMR